MAFHHIPVLLNEVLEALNPQPGEVYADGTLGGGGHSGEILKRMGETGTLYGIDRDEAAIAAATERLKIYPGFHAVHGNFHDVKELLQGVRLNGGLLDLGVSSFQLDTPDRGFSYHEDAPLDMRMDTSRGMTAAEYVNTVSERDFCQALRDYGDEKWAARIAQILMEKRAQKPLKTTADLVAVVDAAIPKAVRRKDEGHPARRTFQAVRIAVNDELAPLEKALNDWVDMLVPGGRLCVITFHSIEDRIVKQAFRKMQNPCTCPPKAPICICGKKPLGKAIGGAIKAGEDELNENSRAHSATLRVFEKRTEE
ncbi:MAG: 16S rRNA (cytosine(1402)-N(4))-methyltransferase RsmH [Clostridia bacterium]|nr:16S rRNA (cytosine(1402)-N(4))-methyltransferase RsmH [Clostridia bacterium]MBQ6960367.1 16S rRNA (cytosine(1402)-N(4))-methyltransferase RsmH [Clostridia bacterium]